MNPQRLPGAVLSITAGAFLVWSVILVTSPGGSLPIEWAILGVSAGLLMFGLLSLRTVEVRRVGAIRWLLTAFALFGAVAVMGLTADDNSSRTWVRLGWSALLAGFVTSVAVWWNAPRASRRMLLTGGVVGLIVIAGGVGITVNCDKSLQRSWCDPVYEQEEALGARIDVVGELQRSGRAGGDTGAYLRAYFIEGTVIGPVTTVPEGFVYEERPLQSTEVTRGRYTTASGPDANCQIDIKVEELPAGNLETLTVSCGTSG